MDLTLPAWCRWRLNVGAAGGSQASTGPRKVGGAPEVSGLAWPTSLVGLALCLRAVAGLHRMGLLALGRPGSATGSCGARCSYSTCNASATRLDHQTGSSREQLAHQYHQARAAKKASEPL